MRILFECNLEGCYWNKQPQGRCQLLGFDVEEVVAIVKRTIPGRNAAANCARFGEDDDLDEMISRVQKIPIMTDDPEGDTRRALNNQAAGVQRQYPPVTGWKPT